MAGSADHVPLLSSAWGDRAIRLQGYNAHDHPGHARSCQRMRTLNTTSDLTSTWAPTGFGSMFDHNIDFEQWGITEAHRALPMPSEPAAAAPIAVPQATPPPPAKASPVPSASATPADTAPPASAEPQVSGSSAPAQPEAEVQVSSQN